MGRGNERKIMSSATMTGARNRPSAPSTSTTSALPTPTPTLNTAPIAQAETEPRRLVVELNRRSAADLAWLTVEEELNKTTVVNRALQAYRILVEAAREGKSLLLEDPNSDTYERLRFL